MKRSLAAKKFLIEKGINDSLIKVQALGEEQPLVASTTPMQKSKNRKIELVVLFQQAPQLKLIDIKSETNIIDRSGDTTVTFEGGYSVLLSKQNWDKNTECLHVTKRFTPFKFSPYTSNEIYNEEKNFDYKHLSNIHANIYQFIDVNHYFILPPEG